MKLLGNLLWLLFAGFWFAVGYVIAGILNCMTIIGIPFGIQAFKLAGYALWPFGRVVIERQDRDVALGCLGNGIWFVFGGLFLALGWVFVALIFFITIIGIPFGVISFRMARLALFPFGKVVVRDDQVPPGAHVFIGRAAQLA